MKKILKIGIIILVLLLLIAIPMGITCIRNYQIYEKIENAGNEFFNSSNYQIISKDSMGNNSYLYFKNDIWVLERIGDTKDDTVDVYWKNNATGEEVFTYQKIYEAQGASVSYDETIPDLKKLATLQFSNKSLFNIITEEDGCYVVKRRGDGWETLYDKETGLPKKDRQVLNGKVMTEEEYIFELNTVTDEMLEKPVPIPVE